MRVRDAIFALSAGLAVVCSAETPMRWRGLMLDEARHFFGKDAVIRLLERMAREKYNVFHWHLTDHHGWRLQIRRCPELTERASVRDVAEWRRIRTEGWDDPDQKTYGPYFYTQDEIREVVAHAASLGITVVPEIEIPGHCRALLKALPSLQCEGVSALLDEVEKGYRCAVVCAGNDETLRFYENVIDEVCELFPSPVIHLGGDEVKKDFWKSCPKCQARIRREGLNDANALQGWMMRHFEKYLASKGRRLAGWNEILEDGLTTNAVVFCWRGGDVARRAVEAGYDVVQCPEEYCYFDFRQSAENDGRVYHPRGDKVFPPLTVEKVRSFDPLAGIPPELQGHVLGAQANNWTELTLNEETLNWKIWPRAAALAKVLRREAARPEITWSIMHPIVVEPAYMRRVVDKAAEYGGVDSFEICGECNQPHGGLNGLLAYEPYPKTAAAIDRNAVETYRRKLRETVDVAHGAGKRVYFWHREGFMPKTMHEDVPGLLDEDGEYDLLGKPYLDYVRWKVRESFRQVPELDGVVLTLTEADFSVIHNSRPDRYPPAKVVETITRIFLEEHRRLGKRLIFRSFGSIKSDYEDLIAGANACAADYEFEIETKITPFDFSPFLPANPYLKKTSRCTIGAECDCLGEYLGAGYLPATQVDAVSRYVGYGRTANVDRYTIRIDRVGNSIFDSAQEVNLYTYMRFIRDSSATVEKVLDEWAAKCWPKCTEEMKELAKMSFDLVEATQFIDHNVCFHQNPPTPSFKFIKFSGILGVFRDGMDLHMTEPMWGMMSAQKTPGRAAIRAEKSRAEKLAAEGLAKIESLKDRLDPDEYARQHRAWSIAAKAVPAMRSFWECVAAYFDDMDANDPAAPHLAATIDVAEKTIMSRMKSTKIDLSEFNLNACRARGEDLDKVYFATFLWLSRELMNEYRAEYAARAKLRDRKDVIDFVIPGGIYDDVRVRRVMHSSYQTIDGGVPVRFVGNAAFPNGTIAVEFKDVEGACVEVDADPKYAKDLTVVEKSANGVRSVTIAKKGASYPGIRSIALVKQDVGQ